MKVKASLASAEVSAKADQNGMEILKFLHGKWDGVKSILLGI